MIPMFFPTFSPSPSILPIQYLLFIQHLTGYACALQSLLDTVPSGKRTEKTGAFIKTTQYSLPHPARHQTRNARKRQGTAGNAGNKKILRKKEERGRDGWPLHGVIVEGWGEANIPPGHKSRTLPTNLEMPEEVLQFIPADIGQTNGSNCLTAQLVAGMDDGVCGTVMKQRHSRPFTVFKTNL